MVTSLFQHGGYDPATPGDWSPEPERINEALDTLALNATNAPGTQIQWDSAVNEVIHSGAGRTTVLSVTTPSVPAGTYRILATFLWRKDSASTAAFCVVDLVVNANIRKTMHGQVATANVALRTTGALLYYDTLAAGIHTVHLDLGDEGNGDSYIYDRTIELWRVA